MSLIVLSSLGQSPGVSTAALALTMNWPRPVVLVEADTSKPSSVLPGFLQGTVPATSGLNTLAELTALPGHQLTVRTMWPSLVQLPGGEGAERYLLHGFSNPAAARGATTLWPELAGVLNDLEAGGVDALVDLGRWQGKGDRASVIRQADLALWCTSTTLPGIAATAANYSNATAERAADGRGEFQGILGFAPYAGAFPDREFSRYLGAPVLGSVPHSPKAAAYYGQGLKELGARSVKGFDRHMRGLAAALSTRATEALSILRPQEAI